MRALAFGSLRHLLLVVGPEAAEGGARQHRVHGRRLEEEGDLPGAPLREVVARHRLGRAVEGADGAREEARAPHHRVEEGAAPHLAVRVVAAAEQDLRRADGPGRENHEARSDHHLARRGPEGRVEPHRVDRGDAAPRLLEANHAGPGVDLGPRLHRVVEVGEVEGVLGADGAARPAVAERLAPGDVPAGHLPGVAQLSGAVPEDAVVLVGGLDGPGGDGEAPLHRGEVGLEGLLVEPGHAEGLGPVAEHARRGAEAGGPVDQRSPAHAAPLQDGDGEVGGGPHAAVLVEGGVGPGFVHPHLVGGEVAAFLEHRHPEPARRQPRRHHRATRPGAHHADVGAVVDVLAEGGGVDDAPRGVGHGFTSGVAGGGASGVVGGPSVMVPGTKRGSRSTMPPVAGGPG